MKKIVIMAAMTLAGITAQAQNSVIFKAQPLEQKGDLRGAIALYEAALQNPKTTKFAEIHHKTAENYAKIFNGELDKAAHQMPFDTVVFCNALDNMIDHYTKSHQADIQPDKKGRVEPKFEMANRARLMFMLDYYNYAAMFMYQNRDTVQAINYFEKYLALPDNPIFSKAQADSIRTVKHQAYNQTAINMATLNYSRKAWDKAIKYADIALKDDQGLRDLYIIKMQSQAAMGDSAAWLSTITEAVGRTEDAMFMQNLLYYYVSKNDQAGAEKMAGEMVAQLPTSKAAWYMKGCVELNMKKAYTEARSSFEKALAIDPDFVEANINTAYTYVNQVVADKMAGKFKFIGTSKRITPAQEAAYKKELALVQSYYKSALPYMERVRQLIPDKPRQWAHTLQMIYENLQMKTEKAEIDAIIANI